jgi:hypothetical protein
MKRLMVARIGRQPRLTRRTVSLAKKPLDGIELGREGASGAPGRAFGLMKAVDKFEYRRGYTFGLRHVVRTIRIPVHTMEAISRVVRTSGLIFNEIGREPMVKWCL